MIRTAFDSSRGVARVSLATPERANALTPDDIRALARAVEAAGREPELRCLVLEAEGDTFSAGADLDALANVSAEALLASAADDFSHLAQAFATCPAPTLCALNGPAVGGGAGVALLADVIVASANAKLVFPFARLGLVPDSGLTKIVTTALGPSRTRLLFLSGGAIDAATAFQAGLVSQCVPADEFASAVANSISILSRTPPGLAPALRELIDDSNERSLSEQIVLEARAQAERLSLPQTRGAIAAALATMHKPR